MNLVELPDGNWINPNLIVGVVVAPAEPGIPVSNGLWVGGRPTRLVIHLEDMQAHTIYYSDEWSATEARATLIDRLKQIADLALPAPTQQEPQ